jgi:hypothetical protein
VAARLGLGYAGAGVGQLRHRRSARPGGRHRVAGPRGWGVGVAEYLDRVPECGGCLSGGADRDLRRAVVPGPYSGASLPKLYFSQRVGTNLWAYFQLWILRFHSRILR